MDPGQQADGYLHCLSCHHRKSDVITEVPSLGRQVLLGWADKVLVS